MDIRPLAGTPMTVTVKDVPLAKLPHALRVAAHSLSSYLQIAGIAPEDWEPGDSGCFLCPFCAQEHALVPEVFHGGEDPATGLEEISGHQRVHGLVPDDEEIDRHEDTGGGAVS